MQSTWVSGHQPIANFHTGLIAKIYETTKRKGTFLVHDLDTLEERGACTIIIPTSHGKLSPFRICSAVSKNKLFIYGPVTCTNLSGLTEPIKSLANGRLPKPMLEEIGLRLEYLNKVFPVDRRFKSVTQLNMDLLNLVTSRIGIVMPSILYLSEVLRETSWQAIISQYIQEKTFTYRNFWVKTDNEERRPALPTDPLEGLVEQGELIPKAATLGFLLIKMGIHTIRGIGQERYERESGLVHNDTEAVTITSDQSVPSIWKEFVPKDFRPSALLLWLLGGQFDPKAVIKNPLLA
jgi:hypothetical protein